MPPREGSGSSRSAPAWLLGVAALLLLARIVTGIIAARAPVAAAVDLVSWRPIATALAEARASGRMVLYDFTADWCPPCHTMASEVFADARSAKTIAALFVPVRVLDRTREQGRNPTEVSELQARYRVTAFPTLVLVNPDGGDPVVIEGYPGKQPLIEKLVAAGVRSRIERGAGPARPDMGSDGSGR